MMDTGDKDSMIPQDARPGFVRNERDTARNLSDAREFWLKGDHIVRMCRVLLLVHESERVDWVDMTYIPDYDITRLNVSLSPAIHKVRLIDLLGDAEYVEIDYEVMPPEYRCTADDLHFLEEKLGLL